jgi:hypothetical protein
MLGSNYWNGDTRLLFGIEIQALVSSRCSPETSCYSPSSGSITSKLYLIPRKGRAQKMEMLPSLHESSPSSKLLQVQDFIIWWTNTYPWHDRSATLRLHSSTIVTTPPEIVPYYRLNHSFWSLSDNKEASCWVLPGLHPVNHLEHREDRTNALKLPRRRVQSALQITHHIPVGFIITNIVLWHESKWFRV